MCQLRIVIKEWQESPSPAKLPPVAGATADIYSSSQGVNFLLSPGSFAPTRHQATQNKRYNVLVEMNPKAREVTACCLCHFDILVFRIAVICVNFIIFCLLATFCFLLLQFLVFVVNISHYPSGQVSFKVDVYLRFWLLTVEGCSSDLGGFSFRERYMVTGNG